MATMEPTIMVTFKSLRSRLSPQSIRAALKKRMSKYDHLRSSEMPELWFELFGIDIEMQIKKNTEDNRRTFDASWNKLSIG
jgi:hypothetical protein